MLSCRLKLCEAKALAEPWVGGEPRGTRLQALGPRGKSYARTAKPKGQERGEAQGRQLLKKASEFTDQGLG